MLLKRKKKSFYKYMNKKRRTKENLNRFLVVGGNIVTINREKIEVLNAFFALVCSSKTTCSLGTQPPELIDKSFLLLLGPYNP